MKISDLLLRAVEALEAIAASLKAIAAKPSAPNWYVPPDFTPPSPPIDPGVPRVPRFGPVVLYGCQMVDQGAPPNYTITTTSDEPSEGRK
jgi:hypothetical protein